MITDSILSSIFDKGFSDMKNIIHGIKNNRLLHFIIFFVAFCSINIFSMRMTEKEKASAKRWLGIAQKEEAIRKKRDLLIFLDDSEKGEKFGFTGSHLVTAIGQKVSPIIVSTYTLNHITNEETRYYFVSGFFQSSEWIVKKINNSLNLLIPINYLKTLKIDADKVKIFDGTIGIDVVSDIELQLGLKVNHMENIEYQLMNRFTYHITQVSQFLGYSYTLPQQPKLEFADYLIDSLDNIFCKRLDYQGRSISVPEWLIYLAGHGFLLHSIAHISLDGFKKLLYFLDTKINTKLLVISSCYAAGINVNKVYGEMELGTQEYYSYPIIIQALNDTLAVVTDPNITVEGFFYKHIHLKTHIDFINFFKKAKELEGNYGEIIKPVLTRSIQNVPQIKLPSMEWFSVIDIDKSFVSIGSKLVKARDSQKPLDIISFFKKDPIAILLYTDNIPFELVVNSSQVKFIISMVSPQLIEEKKEIKEVYIRIKQILSTQSFSDILSWFGPVRNGIGFNVFCIDELNDKKDIIILRTGDGAMRVYYTDQDNNAFTTKLWGTEKEIIFEKLDKDSEFDKYYQDFIRERDKYSELSKEKEKQEISAEQVKEIEDVQQKKIETQKKLKEAYTVSEPEVD